MTVKAVKHADIRGKEQLYLVLEEGTEKVVINIGQKTYDSVNNLLNPKGKKEDKK